ncbi:DUF2141 domain-containing protein [Thalassomonas sp. M1454]|uniref:DUF2141 domain-containing protein n=1 Tax=Thalassomonas sp. M1454 TaxID=2594477 RepID=UPI00117CD954|nr:DUF2141 domain-containing protein [Thalassomonas sp. M1454]TRX54986.1 DUF2141 domain-containing protein [Thalassomonas sp. M1454]
MKALFTSLLLLCSSQVFAATLTIEINDIASEKGEIVINVYDKEKNWMEEKSKYITKQSIVPLAGQVRDGKLVTTIELPEGEYGLYIYQDWDSNKEMDSNWIGIPREPVATSNNAKGSMGPPDYDDAKFNLPATGATQSVNIVEI